MIESKRTEDEINTEFAQIVMKLGQISLDMGKLEAERQALFNKINELSAEMKEVKNDG